MLFTNKEKFQKNFLVVMVSEYFERMYRNREFDIYNELNGICGPEATADGKPILATKEQVNEAIKHFREGVAHDVLEFVGKEYHDALEPALGYLNILYEQDYCQCATYGFTPSMVYSIAVKMARGDDYKFHFITSDRETPDEVEKMDFEDMIAVMLKRVEEKEAHAIHTSFDISIEDKLCKDFPEYNVK